MRPVRTFIAARLASCNPIRVHIATIAAVATVLLFVVGFGLFNVMERSSEARDVASAQFLAGRTSMNVAQALQIAEGGVRAGNPPPAATGSLPPPPIADPAANVALPPADAVELARVVREIERDAVELDKVLDDGTATDLSRVARHATTSLDVYLQVQSPAEFRALQDDLVSLGVRANEIQPIIAARVDSASGATVDAAQRALAWLLLGIPFGATGVALTGWLLGRRMHLALAIASDEKTSLEQTAAIMHRRNGQFQALYNVITEVTESLSLRYVVETTLREARRLVAADMVVLRLLEGDQLITAGTSQDGEGTTLRNVTLGNGIVGKVARRGRSALLLKDAEKSMAAEERIPWAESGVVVPLIVGARIAGTLGCWARKERAFDEEDQQVLEMMASQVAVAVVAASTHEASERDAHHDPLTGVPNRRHLTRDIHERFTPAMAAGQPIAFAMVDIDHFKRFNDEFGHRAGDITLQKVAEVLRNSIRTGDRVYRYGGEEFTIVFDGAEGKDAIELMDRVRDAVARTTLTGLSGEPIGPVTISAGVACGPVNGTDCDLLIKLADDALYQSKWTGRNRVTLYSDSIAALPEAA